MLPLILSASLWSCISTTRQGEPDSPEISGPLASSGGVQITRITTARRRSGYSVYEIDNTLTLDIWILCPKKVDTNPNCGFLLRMVEIKPIRDNNGKVLKPAKGQGDNKVLTEEIRAESIVTRGNDNGPALKLCLDASAREASAIRLFKGKMEVIEAESKSLTLPNLAALDGKFIDHADLKDVKIKPVITKTPRGDTNVAMQVTGKTARLTSWFLTKDGKELEASSGGQSLGGQAPIENGVEFSKGFNGRLPEDVALTLLVLVPTRSHLFDFEMKNIELPWLASAPSIVD